MRAKLFFSLLSLLFLGVSLPLVIFTIQQQHAATRQQAATSTPLPVGQTGNRNLIFDDEFNGTSLDTTKWNTCYPNFQVGTDSCDHNNGELELYQPGQVLVANGILTLRAEKKAVTAGGKTFNYSSGMISSGPGANGSKAKFAFTYGFMEMRAKMPKGQGFWPAFWTLPVDGSWPPEIDLFEILGNDPTTVYMTYHWGANNSSSGTTWKGPDFSAGWHTYALDWEPNAITWYIDGVERKQYTNALTITNKPMYLLANFAVGGSWPGSPNSTTVFPADYQIDYIRVWQKCTTNCSTAVATLPTSLNQPPSSPTQYCLGSCLTTAASPNVTALPSNEPITNPQSGNIGSNTQNSILNIRNYSGADWLINLRLLKKGIRVLDRWYGFMEAPP